MQVFLALLLLILLTAAAGYLFFLRQQKQFTGNLGPRETSPTKGSPGDKIVLTGSFTPVRKLAGSVSPFTNKIETYLRFAGLPHKTENGGFASSPKGRVCPSFLLPHLLHLKEACLWQPCSTAAIATTDQLGIGCSCHGCNMAKILWQTRDSSLSTSRTHMARNSRSKNHRMQQAKQSLH